MEDKIQDRASTEWLRVKAHCIKKLNELRDDNERDLDPVETAKIRGAISLAREILEMEEKEKTVDVPNTKYIE